MTSATKELTMVPKAPPMMMPYGHVEDIPLHGEFLELLQHVSLLDGEWCR
jgi:hypothetical protein